MMAKKKLISKLVPADLVEDYGEVGVSQLIDASKQFLPVLDSVSKEVPYVKTLVAAVKVPQTLSDFILGRKVNAFLYSSGLNKRRLRN